MNRTTCRSRPFKIRKTLAENVTTNEGDEMTTNCKTPAQSMDDLYNSRDETGDITFLVGSERIMTHRCVLAAVSPKYKAQFFGLNPDHGEVRVPNVSAAAFNVFLQFFYKQKVGLTVENIEAVLDLATQSLVDGFVDTCVRFIQNKTTPQNVCWAYGLALKYSLESVRSHCELQIRSDPEQVFASDDFLQCDHDMLLNILKMDSLGCAETVVFNACISWARADCKQKKLDDGQPKNLRAALGDAIYQIRFSSMTANEFVTLNNSLPGFLTNDEVIEVFNIVGKLDGFESKEFNQQQRSGLVEQDSPKFDKRIALCGAVAAKRSHSWISDSYDSESEMNVNIPSSLDSDDF